MRLMRYSIRNAQNFYKGRSQRIRTTIVKPSFLFFRNNSLDRIFHISRRNHALSGAGKGVSIGGIIRQLWTIMLCMCQFGCIICVSKVFDPGYIVCRVKHWAIHSLKKGLLLVTFKDS